MRKVTVGMLCVAIAALTVRVIGQSAPAAYLTPPKAIVDILDAEPLPTVVVSPAQDTLALLERRSMPSIEELSQPMLRLAGERINPRNTGPHRAANGIALTLRTIATGAERKIALPPGARLGIPSFSPDGKRLYFTNTRETRMDLYIADVATAQARMVDAPFNGVSGDCEWLDDSSGLVCGFVPAPRAAASAPPKAPSGPNVQENSGKQARSARTRTC
jgi:dipeptidyl aminopeptidase/acylaminoacyl peptidase